MANLVLWDATWVDRGDLLTTDLDSLGNGAYSAVSTAFDNAAGLHRFGICEIVLGSLDPTAGAYVAVFLVQSADGTNYEDAPSSNNPGLHMLVAQPTVDISSSAKRIVTPVFRLPAGKFKFVVQNGCGVSFASSGNVLALYTANEEIQ